MDHPGVGNNVVFTGGGSRTYSVAAGVSHLLLANFYSIADALQTRCLTRRLARKGAIYASYIGNELIDRATPDGASRISFIDRDLMMMGNGKVVSWDVYAGRAGTQRLQIWREASGEGDTCVNSCSVSRAATGSKTWKLVCENVVTSPTAGATEHFQLADSDTCSFRFGDRVGWYHENQGVTVRTTNGPQQHSVGKPE
jgi:hypothetical protein